jgi:hypothetical protein
MRVLVTNNSFGSPIIWEYDSGIVERIDLIDFNTHTLFPDNSFQITLPLDLFETIIDYMMTSLLETRNFDLAFQLCTINKRSCFWFYTQIYGQKDLSTLVMLYRLSRSFRLADSLYDEYLCCPNPTASGLNAVALYRNGSLRYNPRFDPWDFIREIEVQRLNIDPEETFTDIHTFAGQFHGDSVWVHGTEDDGIYTTDTIHHPVLVLICCDYSYALIPTRQSINQNWRQFIKFLRRAFGQRTGVYIMVKHQNDEQNPFIETTDLLVQV